MIEKGTKFVQSENYRQLNNVTEFSSFRVYFGLFLVYFGFLDCWDRINLENNWSF